MSYFTNKVVIVTGGTSGIGRALVDLLLLKGAKVATCSRDYDRLYQLQMQYSEKPLMIQRADISFEGDCHRLIELTIKTFGHIDILINNAGVTMHSLFRDTSLETMHNVMNVNFWGAVSCTRFALPYLIASRGSIIGITAVAGYMGVPGRSGYAASKFALNGWMESIRTELEAEKVHVMLVCPGRIDSSPHLTVQGDTVTEEKKASSGYEYEQSAAISADDAAVYILKSIEKKKRAVILTADGKERILISRFFPSWADKLIRKLYFRDGNLIK